MLPDTIKLDPKNLEVANQYLQTPNVQEVANTLQLPIEVVIDTIKLPECKRYIDQVFMDMGYNNRFLLREALDQVIKQKFQELDASELGSNKDIADLLLQSHKMSMDLLDREIQLLKLQQEQKLQNQVNVQINNDLGSNYQQLLERLLKC
jgi:hypothetical protein